MTKFHVKRGLPPRLPDLFEEGRVAHVVIITHKRSPCGDPVEHVVMCMSRRHEYLPPSGIDENPTGEDPVDWEEILGDRYEEPESVAVAKGEKPDDAAASFKDVNTTIQTSYRKCKQTGDLCYLLITGSRKTCLRIGGNASGLALCSS